MNYVDDGKKEHKAEDVFHRSRGSEFLKAEDMCFKLKWCEMGGLIGIIPMCEEFYVDKYSWIRYLCVSKGKNCNITLNRTC